MTRVPRLPTWARRAVKPFGRVVLVDADLDGRAGRRGLEAARPRRDDEGHHGDRGGDEGAPLSDAPVAARGGHGAVPYSRASPKPAQSRGT